jgi:hypothetical protein
VGADDALGVTAARRDEPALATGYDVVAERLIPVNAGDEQPSAELVLRRTGEVADEQYENEEDGGETSPPPSTLRIRFGLRTCRQTR